MDPALPGPAAALGQDSQRPGSHPRRQATLSQEEAANDLYAGWLQGFLHAIWPQTVPWISVGITLTFIPAMGMFVVPGFLGGGNYKLIGNLIQQQFDTSRDGLFVAVSKWF